MERIKKISKKVKQRLRPVWSNIKKSLKKKKNQRRLIVVAGIFIIILLSSVLISAVQKQNKLEAKIVESQQTIQKTEKEVQKLNQDIAEKQKTIDSNAKTIEEKTQKQAELEKKIQELDGQIKDLKSAYGGYGGSISVANTQYTAGNSYTPGYCTWGVKSWKPSVPNFWGNANQWDDNARASGILVDSNPSVGAVAQTDGGGSGHVALVIAVVGDLVTIKEMNYGGLYTVNTRTVSSYEFNYIHI